MKFNYKKHILVRENERSNLFGVYFPLRTSKELLRLNWAFAWELGAENRIFMFNFKFFTWNLGIENRKF